MVDFIVGSDGVAKRANPLLPMTRQTGPITTTQLKNLPAIVDTVKKAVGNSNLGKMAVGAVRNIPKGVGLLNPVTLGLTIGGALPWLVEKYRNWNIENRMAIPAIKPEALAEYEKFKNSKQPVKTTTGIRQTGPSRFSGGVTVDAPPSVDVKQQQPIKEQEVPQQILDYLAEMDKANKDFSDYLQGYMDNLGASNEYDRRRSLGLAILAGGGKTIGNPYLAQLMTKPRSQSQINQTKLELAKLIQAQKTGNIQAAYEAMANIEALQGMGLSSSSALANPDIIKEYVDYVNNRYTADRAFDRAKYAADQGVRRTQIAQAGANSRTNANISYKKQANREFNKGLQTAVLKAITDAAMFGDTGAAEAAVNTYSQLTGNNDLDIKDILPATEAY